MPDPSYRSAPLVRETHTNADEVLAFLAEHPKGTRFEEGELFTLPDIEQTYTIHAVRSFRRGQRTVIYLELMATCAVEDCENEFLCTKAVDELRKSQYLTRTCEEHRRAWSTPWKDAWSTSEEIRAREAAAETRRQEALERAAVVRYGTVEQAVLDAARELAVLRSVVGWRELRDHAAQRLVKPAKRDTRWQQAQRAMNGLVEKGVLYQRGWELDLGASGL